MAPGPWRVFFLGGFFVLLGARPLVLPAVVLPTRRAAAVGDGGTEPLEGYSRAAVRHRALSLFALPDSSACQGNFIFRREKRPYWQFY